MPHYSYQVFKNLSPESNPHHSEGKSQFEFLSVAYCATPGGPVDARGIKGLEKNYDTVREFLDACTEAGYLAKESGTRYDDEGTEITDPEYQQSPAQDPPAQDPAQVSGKGSGKRSGKGKHGK